MGSLSLFLNENQISNQIFWKSLIECDFECVRSTHRFQVRFQDFIYNKLLSTEKTASKYHWIIFVRKKISSFWRQKFVNRRNDSVNINPCRVVEMIIFLSHLKIWLHKINARDHSSDDLISRSIKCKKKSQNKPTRFVRNEKKPDDWKRLYAMKLKLDSGVRRRWIEVAAKSQYRRFSNE